MGASLLSAIGLPELVTATPQAYEELAIELATSSGKLRAIKDKLASNRLTTPLFDTKRFIRHIEAAYTEAYRHYSAGSYPGTTIKFAGSSAAAFSGADRLFEGPLEAG